MTAESDTDAATIEEDVRRTQDQIGETVDRLEERLNFRGIVDTFVGPDSRANARQAWGIARENPAPAALIAFGTVWLFATSETPVIRNIRERLISQIKASTGLDQRDTPRGAAGPPAETGSEFDHRL